MIHSKEEQEPNSEIKQANPTPSEKQCPENNKVKGENFLNDLDEKFTLAIKNEAKTVNQQRQSPFDMDISDAITKKSTEANLTGESAAGENKIFLEEPENLVSSTNIEMANTIRFSKNQKIFKIKKYVKYNKFLQEICSEEEMSENEKKIYTEPQAKKISPFSKVNFSKLNSEEKDDRLKNLAKLVKRLRRKVRTLENKVRFNATKILNKHICNKLGINTKNKNIQQEFQFDFDKIVKCLRKIRNSNEFEYEDQKHLIENIISLISEDKLKVDSLLYKKVCSCIRLLLPKDRIKCISVNDSKIAVSFPETEVYITNKEFFKIAKFKDNEDLMRAALGVYDEVNDKVIITAETPCLNENEKLDCPSQTSKNSGNNCNNLPKSNGDNLNLNLKYYSNNEGHNVNNNLMNHYQSSGNSNFVNNCLRNNVLSNMSVNTNFAPDYNNVLSNPNLNENFKNINNVNDVNKFNNMNANNSNFDMNQMNCNNNLNYLNYSNHPSNQLRMWLYNQTNNNPNLQQMLMQSYSNIYQNNSSNHEQKSMIPSQKNTNQPPDIGMMNHNFLNNINAFNNSNGNTSNVNKQNSNEKNFILK